MAQQIITVSGDKRIQLLNSQIIRRPIYLDNWTTIRIGLRLNVPSAASLTGTPRLWIGVCSGTTNGFADSTTTNFTGVVTNEATWTRTGTPAYADNIFLHIVKKVATTVTFKTIANLTTNNGISLDQSILNAYIVQITKGSPNYTYEAVVPITAAGIQHNITDTEMRDLMELEHLSDCTTINADYALVNTSNTLACDESAGVFDAINVYWDRTGAPCEISDVYHRKVA